MTRSLLCLAALVWLCAFTQPDERLADPALESRAVAIDRNLRCVVCEGQSVEDSNADMARDMRVLVRQMIAQGKSDDAVYDYLRERYGDRVLMTPRLTPATWLLWLAPVVILAGGALAFFKSTQRRRRA